MKVTHLKEHSIIKSIQPYLISYIEKCGPENNTNVQPSPKERVAFDIISGLSTITECIDQLYFSVEFLSGFRTNITHKLMNRHDYIIYSTENILFRITSVFDRCLRLCNKIFNIGIPDRECRENTIIKNSKIKGTSTSKALNELKKFTDQFKNKRNEIAHANCLDDPSIYEIQAFYHLLGLNTPEIEQYKFLYKKEADNYVATKKTEYLKKIIELEELVNSFFSAICPIVIAIIENKIDS